MTAEKHEFVWPIIGNKGLCIYLQGIIARKRLPHAFLFWGPPHIGKKTLVRWLVQSLLCLYAETSENKKEIPCQTCDQCYQFRRGIHPDVMWVKRTVDEKTKKKKKNISIEQIRELCGQLQSGTFLSPFKIAVISEAERLSLDAANSLLKTLEEPKSRVIMILIAEHPDFLPETVSSRCQVFRVQTSSYDEMYRFLRKNDLSAREATIFANLACGRPGEAIALLRDQHVYRQHQQEVQQFLALLDRDLLFRLERVDDVLKSIPSEDHEAGNDALEKLWNTWILVLRDMLLIQSMDASEDMIHNAWYYEPLCTRAKKIPPGNILSSIAFLEEAKMSLRKNMNHKLLFDNFFLHLV